MQTHVPNSKPGSFLSPKFSRLESFRALFLCPDWRDFGPTKLSKLESSRLYIFGFRAKIAVVRFKNSRALKSYILESSQEF